MAAELKSKKKKLFLGLLIAALLPLSLYMLARYFSDGKIKVPPYYRIDNIVQVEKNGKWVTDTIFHQVKDLQLVNQLGDTVWLNKDLQGKALVIDFIFTRCNSVCPQLSQKAKQIQQAYRKKKNAHWVQFVSISIDPYDTVPVLRAYADNFAADHDKWWFLTGNMEEILQYAREELGVSIQPATSDMFTHSQNFILLDTSRHIRGYYDGLNDSMVSILANDISILMLEKKK